MPGGPPAGPRQPWPAWSTAWSRVADLDRLAAERHREMRLADAGWAEQEQRITVGHPPAGRQIADLLRVERRLGVKLEAVERSDKREFGDAQAHADPPFLAVCHLGGAHQGECLAQ